MQGQQRYRESMRDDYIPCYPYHPSGYGRDNRGYNQQSKIINQTYGESKMDYLSSRIDPADYQRVKDEIKSRVSDVTRDWLTPEQREYVRLALREENASEKEE